MCDKRFTERLNYRTMGVEDFSTLELRIIEQEMAAQHYVAIDRHRLRAVELYGVAYDAVTDKQRQAAKLFNLQLGYLYGAEFAGFGKAGAHAYIEAQEEANGNARTQGR